MVTPTSGTDTTYWLSDQINVTFSPYEDRLIIRAQRKDHGTVHLLLTRRMSMIVLHQLLASLATLSGLSKTPAQYWQDVLHMAHQHAMQAKLDADEASVSSESQGQESSVQPDADTAAASAAIFLATEVTIQTGDQQLLLAFKGLPMPKAMTQPSAHEPVFATQMQIEHMHQLLQLLINKAQEAQWHLPLDLPWLQNPDLQPTSLGASVH